MKSTIHFSKNKRGLECLNCGQPLRGDENFCSECGQVNDEIPLSIKQFISEFFAGFLSFDTQFFNTIVPLLFKPGKVSKEYIKGKRRKYTNPFKMYLHTSIVFFLLMGLISTINNYKKLNQNTTHNEAIKDSIFNELKDKDITLGEMNFSSKYNQTLDSIFLHTDYKVQFNNDNIPQNVKDSLYDNLFNIGMKIKLVDIKIDLKELENFDINANTKEAHKIAVKGFLKKYFKDNSIHYQSSKFYKPPENIISINDEFNNSDFIRFINFSKENEDLSSFEALDSLGIDQNRMNHFKYQKAQDINKLMKDKDFRKSFISSIISKISIALFFLLPLFTLFFSLLYLRHHYTFTEHLVVVFNLQTVFFLFLILGLLLDNFFKTDIFGNSIFPTIFLFYIYKTLRNFYGQRRLKTLIKFFLLNVIYFFLAFIGVIIISFIAFLI
jgi:hypothetical protein